MAEIPNYLPEKATAQVNNFPNRDKLGEARYILHALAGELPKGSEARLFRTAVICDDGESVSFVSYVLAFKDRLGIESDLFKQIRIDVLPEGQWIASSGDGIFEVNSDFSENLARNVGREYEACKPMKLNDNFYELQSGQIFEVNGREGYEITSRIF